MAEDFFDFESVSEEEDNLDYGHLSECPHCKKPIPEDATICYYCGNDVYRDKKSHWFSWLVLIFIILLTGYLVIF